jgi:hypothetical protein
MPKKLYQLIDLYGYNIYAKNMLTTIEAERFNDEYSKQGCHDLKWMIVEENKEQNFEF